jgi:hypothetical protein
LIFDSQGIGRGFRRGNFYPGCLVLKKVFFLFRTLNKCGSSFFFALERETWRKGENKLYTTFSK